MHKYCDLNHVDTGVAKMGVAWATQIVTSSQDCCTCTSANQDGTVWDSTYTGIMLHIRISESPMRGVGAPQKCQGTKPAPVVVHRGHMEKTCWPWETVSETLQHPNSWRLQNTQLLRCCKENSTEWRGNLSQMAQYQQVENRCKFWLQERRRKQAGHDEQRPLCHCKMDFWGSLEQCSNRLCDFGRHRD